MWKDILWQHTVSETLGVGAGKGLREEAYNDRVYLKDFQKGASKWRRR